MTHTSIYTKYNKRAGKEEITAVLTQIKQLITSGLSFAKTAKSLNASGSTTPSGKKWTPHNVGYYVHNHRNEYNFIKLGEENTPLQNTGALKTGSPFGDVIYSVLAIQGLTDRQRAKMIQAAL